MAGEMAHKMALSRIYHIKRDHEFRAPWFSIQGNETQCDTINEIVAI